MIDGIVYKRKYKKRLLAFLTRNEHPVPPTPPPTPPVPTPTTNGSRVYNAFLSRYGAHEWDATVRAIQEWYYGPGSDVRDNWCATSMSYMCNQAGCLNRIGGKNENVNEMRLSCQQAAARGLGYYYDKSNLPAEIPSYCICFWLWSGSTMTDGSSKHVNMCVSDDGDGTVVCIGGNQSDSIKNSRYDKSRLYAIYVIGD